MGFKSRVFPKVEVPFKKGGHMGVVKAYKGSGVYGLGSVGV